MVVDGNRWLLRLMAVSDQSAQDVDPTINGRPMAGMLNLRNVFQLVDDAFDNGALAEHQPVIQRHQPLFHVALKLGHQLNTGGFEQLLCQLLRDIALVRKDFTEQLLQQLGDWGPVIGVAGRETDVEEFTSVIDHQMQFEAKEPIDRSFSACGKVFKHFMLWNPAVVADFQRGGVHKTDAATLTKTRSQISAQWDQCAGNPLDEALIGDETRKRR